MNSADGDATLPGPGPRRSGWRGLLALLSLALALVIWLGGLIDSLQRPSVGDALGLRQLELNVRVAGLLPPVVRAPLVGDAPRAALRQELDRQLQEPAVPPSVGLRLERALLQAEAGSEAGLQDLEPALEQITPIRRPLLRALIDGDRVAPEQLVGLLRPWSASPLLAQLSCERLGGSREGCLARFGQPAGTLLRFLVVSLLPLPVVLAGVLLLLRQLWQWRRGRWPQPPPLQAPPLDGIDLVLLIAGGFVVLGEVLAPLVMAPLLEHMLKGFDLPEALRQGLQVLGLYLALAVAPLVILAGQLAGSGQQRPLEGWLQWRWRPLATAAGSALSHGLMVVPMVALASWLQEQLVGDPGGSNPLLELVLTSGDQLALSCFALTAVVLAPLFEETLFRGVLLPVVGRRWGGGRAVLISAAVFAMAHLSVGEFIPLLVLGLGLGWLRWRSGRLAPCVLLHALWNGFTFANLIALGS
ncbi:MAG: type II CAAX endopeptidase family protein [Cyanobacteriota bacterium]|nr:type II CAAX endopeptidase family protein [Cyanobacteriota bacterium]